MPSLFQFARRLVYSQTTDGPTVTANATESLITNDIVFNPDSLKVGDVIKATLCGKVSNAVTTPGTLRLRARLGAASLTGTTIADSGTMLQNTAVQTDKAWRWEQYWAIRAAGTSGSIISIGTIHRGNADVSAIVAPDLIPATFVGSNTVNTTIANTLSFTATWDVATASITCLIYILEHYLYA